MYVYTIAYNIPYYTVYNLNMFYLCLFVFPFFVQHIEWSSLPDFTNYTISNANLLLLDPIFETSYPRVSSSLVNVILLDSNDNPPALSKKRSQLTLPEDTPLGTRLERFPATDIDSVWR